MITENITYLAHIAEDGRVQTILDHLKGSSHLAKEFAQPFNGESQAELAGLAHDIGKYSSEFQARLNGAAFQVDHATAGAWTCFQAGHIPAAFSVAGHHGGLPDGGNRTDSPDGSTLWSRINRAQKGKLPSCDAWEKEVQLPQATTPSFAIENAAAGMFFTRMLYSCLVDADYLDTEIFMSGKHRHSGGKASEDLLWQRLQAYISKWFPPKTILDQQRCAILENCLQAGKTQAPGLFSLTVPTGGGKTVSSLAFALSHAREHGLQRVIYVIPYTSIIEQTAQTFRDILGADMVLEHHSNTTYDSGHEIDTKNLRYIQATENWDMPVIVTTAVQFFESLFDFRPSRCRKLHNIASSVVIFDEAQMLPLPYLRPCIHAITQLAHHYRVSAVLCTATQPALGPLFQEFLPSYPIRELCPPEHYQQQVFRRVTFRQAGQLTWDALSCALQKHMQVLCIVNSRQSAQEVFRRLNGEGTFHLSTLMYPAHRRNQLAQIRHRLSAGLPCRVVSTSLIEAGVDVDFPAVYRELAGLDAILQAAGRCNREGKQPAEDSIVTIFTGENKVPPLFSKAIDACKATLSQHTDFTSLEAIEAYFQLLFYLEGDKAQDAYHILKQIQSGAMPFRTIAEQFHMIDSPTQTIYIPLGQGKELFQRLQMGERNRFLFRQLGQFSVSIYKDHLSALSQAGDLLRLEDGIYILQNTALYSEHTGLSLTADPGKGWFI